MSRVTLFISALFLTLVVNQIIAQPIPAKSNSIKPTIQLATIYQESTKINDYWISEKLDGVRGYWTGTHLFTKQGNIINTPDRYTHNWPNIPLDGELWSNRNQFQQIVSCVRKKIPNNNCWKHINFMIFDLPTHSGDFSERLLQMHKIVQQSQTTNIAVIKQVKVNSNKQLMEKLKTVVDNQGEGLMLHHQHAYYKSGRSNELMKLKHYQDAEAIVIGYIQGKGKYQGQLGSLQVKTSEGIIFKIGSGFSDKERITPPNIGDIITFKYTGKTKKGVPRFASFMRIRTPKTN